MTTLHAPSPVRPTSDFTYPPFAFRVEKPWGYELIFTPPELAYTGKVLCINAGKRLSLQYHDQKTETVMLLQGSALLLCGDEQGRLQKVEMEPGLGYTIAPYQLHRLIALTNCQIIESSTPEYGTTFRLEDDAGRGNETPEVRESRRSV